MRTNTTTARYVRAARLFGAALLTTALIALPIQGTLAVPSSDQAKASLEAAKAKVDELHHQAEVLTEQYNEAQVQLEAIQERLEQAQAELDAANEDAAEAKGLLSDRTADAYTVGAGSRLEVILGEGSFTDFSDRMTFLGEIQEDNHDLAVEAQNAGQRAAWASADLKEAQAEQKEQQEIIADRKEQILKLVAQQEALVEKYEIEYKQAVEAEKEAARAAAAAAAAAESGGGSGGGGGGGSGSYNAPAPSSGASGAVAAAMSQVGKEYQWGASGPDAYDCSGLTSWAWGRAGVSLPHSSASQYTMLPKVSKSDLQPGDLVFYGEGGVSHVAMYAGGGTIVHAANEQSGVFTSSFGSYWTSAYIGAGRPG